MGGITDFRIAERLFKSKLGIRIRQLLILDKKIVAKRWKSLFVAALDRQMVLAANVVLMTAELAKSARALHAKLLNRFDWLAKFDERAFAEVYATVVTRGRHVDVVVRGLCVERFIPDMDEMTTLFRDLGKLIKAADKDWGAPVLLSGLHTLNRRQIADWAVCSIHKDGRIWVMALIESKSISNMEELIENEGRGTGQFMWNYLRAKGEGLVIDVVDAQGNVMPRTFAAAKVLLEPITNGASKTPKYPTRFIGVIPEKFSARSRLNAKSVGLFIHEWKWPVSQGEMLKLIQAIENDLVR